MTNRRKNYATALYTILCGAFLEFYSWSFLQLDKKRPNNAFLQSCFSSLSRSFPLQVANLFDDTNKVASIRKYLIELKKSHLEKDKELVKGINELLNKNADKLRRLDKRRGNDLAHVNFQIVEEIINRTPKEKRGQAANESVITGKEIIELLLLAERIIKAIIVHEMDKQIDLQNKILPIIKQDFDKLMGVETAANSA